MARKDTNDLRDPDGVGRKPRQSRSIGHARSDPIRRNGCHNRQLLRPEQTVNLESAQNRMIWYLCSKSKILGVNA